MILYKGDTVVAVTKPQLRKINRMKVEHDRFSDLVKNLKQESGIKDTVLNLGQSMIKELTQQKDNYIHIISNNSLLAADLQKQVDALRLDNRKLQLKNKILSFTTIGLAVVTAIKFLL